MVKRISHKTSNLAFQVRILVGVLKKDVNICKTALGCDIIRPWLRPWFFSGLYGNRRRLRSSAIHAVSTKHVKKVKTLIGNNQGKVIAVDFGQQDAKTHRLAA